MINELIIYSNIEACKPATSRDLPRIVIKIIIISYNFLELNFFREHFPWLLVKSEKRQTTNINQKQRENTKIKCQCLRYVPVPLYFLMCFSTEIVREVGNL